MIKKIIKLFLSNLYCILVHILHIQTAESYLNILSTHAAGQQLGISLCLHKYRKPLKSSNMKQYICFLLRTIYYSLQQKVSITELLALIVCCYNNLSISPWLALPLSHQHHSINECHPDLPDPALPLRGIHTISLENNSARKNIYQSLAFPSIMI